MLICVICGKKNEAPLQRSKNLKAKPQRHNLNNNQRFTDFKKSFLISESVAKKQKKINYEKQNIHFPTIFSNLLC